MTDPEWIFRDAPRGEHMPIDCAYTYSRGEAIWDRDDLPEGWGINLIPNDDERVAAFPCANMPQMVVGGREVLMAFLVNPAGEAVATWDEGRWWTPQESAAFTLMLQTPATYVMAEGLRQASMPRWWRRKQKRRRR